MTDSIREALAVTEPTLPVTDDDLLQFLLQNTGWDFAGWDDDLSTVFPLSTRDILEICRAVLAWGRPALAPPDGEVAELVVNLRRLAPQNPLGTADPTITRAATLLEQQQARIAELDNEVETQRMKVVCCGMVAVSDTPFSAAKNRACHPDYWSEAAEDVARQIDELMRLREVLKPVPVAERLPGPEDCDAEGRCWWFVPASVLPDGICPYWCLAPAGSPPWLLRSSWFTHWLPAHALPIPQQDL